jgi:hypothetical protein
VGANLGVRPIRTRHPGESRGPEGVETPLWRNWIAAFAEMTERFSSPGAATPEMKIDQKPIGNSHYFVDISM